MGYYGWGVTAHDQSARWDLFSYANSSTHNLVVVVDVVFNLHSFKACKLVRVWSGPVDCIRYIS